MIGYPITVPTAEARSRGTEASRPYIASELIYMTYVRPEDPPMKSNRNHGTMNRLPQRGLRAGPKAAAVDAAYHLRFKRMK